MPHKNFYQFKAKDNYELGLLMGTQFKDVTKDYLAIEEKKSNWDKKLALSKQLLELNRKIFPQYLEELQGYAKGAELSFDELYVLSLEDEFDEEFVYNRCTTMITNGGKLFAHNEDWNPDSKDRINVIEKSIGDLSIFELYYAGTLGGNSISINLNGYVIGLNSLVSTDLNFGLSKNLLCRFMQETNDVDGDIEILKGLPRSAGYNYNIVNEDGKIWNIEYTSSHLRSSNPVSPFCHSNHYLSDLAEFEANTNRRGTFNRLDSARAGTKAQMSADEMSQLMNDTSFGEMKSIMNNETIAKIIIDIENKLAKIWLLREDELGFVNYDLTSYFS